ncbi:unnamed protein product [Closterium sp. NIES-64]|nr:unnamed protein product [Closterium sp. NIES-64]
MSEADRINPTNATSPAIASLRSDCNAASIINLKEMSADLPPLDPTSIRGSGRVANASATDAAANASADATSPATDAAASGDADGAAIGGATASEGPIMEPDSDERVWRKVPLAQGDSDPHVWRKVLYLRQPFDDTHTDPRTFLADMRTNAGVVKPRYWSLVRDSSVLTLQVRLSLRSRTLTAASSFQNSHRLSNPCYFFFPSFDQQHRSHIRLLPLSPTPCPQMLLVSALTVVYVFLDSHRLSTRTLFLLDSLAHYTYPLSSTHTTPPPFSPPASIRFPDMFLVSALMVVYFFLDSHRLSARTLFLLDSLSLAAALVVVYFFLDSHRLSARTLFLLDSLSLAAVYAFMWLALSVFSLLPSLLHHWRRANPQTHRVLVWGMKAVALAVLMAWHKGFAVVVVVAAAAVTYVFPLLFVYMHKEKQFIKGPWDEAQPGTSSS